MKSERRTKMHDPEYAITLCTILQIALVDLLNDFDIWPAAVVGQSSGEIAAAWVSLFVIVW